MKRMPFALLLCASPAAAGDHIYTLTKSQQLGSGATFCEYRGPIFTQKELDAIGYPTSSTLAAGEASQVMESGLPCPPIVHR
jgi:hypothetical protein